MASVIAGSGLGLFNSLSAGTAGSIAMGQGREQVYLNAATGNLVLQNVDETLQGKGVAFGLVRTYNSASGNDGDNKDQWRMGHISSVVLEGTANTAGSRVRRVNGDGFEQVFDWSGTKYISKTGGAAYDTLTWSAAGAVVTFDNGTVETFNTKGDLTKRSDADGEVRIVYNTQNQASSVVLKKTDGTEDVSTLVYHANGLLKGLKTSSANGASQLVTYEYDTSNRLSKVRVDLTPANATDAVFYDTVFTYVGTTSRLETVSQSDGSKLTIGYYADGRIKSLTDAANRTTLAEYINANQTRLTVAGEVTDYFFDGAERLLRTERTVGFDRLVSSYSYTVNGQLESVTDAEGAKVRFGYDAMGNLISQTDALNNTRTRTYNAQSQLLTDTFDGKTERYVYDANGLTLRFKVAADGAVSEYRYNAAGLLSEARVYSQDVYSVAGLSAATAPSLSAMTTWLGAMTNKSKQQLTAYEYDWRGQLSKTTSYSSLDSAGKGTGLISSLGYVYDLHGRLLIETTARGIATTTVVNDFSKVYTYDGLGRMLSVKDALNKSTTYVYSDSTQKQTVTYANGLIETTTFDKTGIVVSVQRANNAATTLASESYLYDAQGRLALTKDAYGQLESRLYDTAGRLGATLDKNSYLTRYHYDKAGRLVSKTEYNSAVSRSGWYSGTSVLMTLDKLDLQLAKVQSIDTARRTTQFVYDAAGNKCFEIDAEGWVTKFTYDKAGRLLTTARRTVQLEEKYRTEPYFWNPTTPISNWWLYAAQQPGSISLVDDATLGTKVVQLTGTGTATGFQLSANNQQLNFEDSLHSMLQWQMDYANAGWTMFIDVNTSLGQRYVQYTPGNAAAEPRITNTNYLQFALDANLFGKGWVNVSRDLTADIQSLEPNNQLLSIKAVLVRGSGKFATVQAQGINLAALEGLGGSYQAVSTQTYTSTGQLETVTDGEGYKTQFTYDRARQKVAQRQFATQNSLVPSASDRVAYWLYDAAGRVAADVNADGVVSSYSYTTEGLLETSAQYATVNRSYTLGASLTLPAGGKRQISFSYDAAGRLLRETNAEGLSTVLKYDAMGNVIERWRGALSNETAAVPVLATGTTWGLERTQYDLLNHVTATLDANSNASLGATATQSVVDGAFATTATSRMVYDNQGRVTDSYDANGKRTLYFYDVAGRLRVIVDAERQVTRYEYNAFDEQIKQYKYNRAIAAADYQAIIEQKNTSSTAHLWATTSKIYTLLNLAEFSVGRRDETSNYNRSGQITSVVDSNNVTRSFTYNVLSKLIKTVVASEAGWNATSQVYNLLSNTVDLTLDKRGLLTGSKTTAGISSGTAQTFDAFGRLLNSTDAMGKMTTYAYSLPSGVADTVGRVAQTSLSVTPLAGAATKARTLRVDYDAYGRELKTTDAENRVTVYTYDDVNRTVTVTTADGVSTISSRDLLGRVIQVEVKKGSVTLQKQSFEYDNHGNLLNTYRYDGATKLRVSSASYSKTHQLQTQTDAVGLTVTLGYDAIGRQILSAYQLDRNDKADITSLTTVKTATVYRERYGEMVAGVIKHYGGYEIEQTGPSGTQVTLYDAIGQVVSVRLKETLAGGAIRYVATDYSYSRSGKVLTSVSGVVYTLGAGNVWSAGNYSKANATRNEYDGLQRVVKQTQLNVTGGSLKTAPVLQTTTFSYDNSGRLLETVRNPGGSDFQRELLTYNEAGEILLRIQVADNLGASGKGRVTVTGYQYDRKGRVVASSQLQDYVTLSVAANSTSPAYATITTEVTNAYKIAAKTTRYSVYDALGRQTASIDAVGTVSYNRYDDLGRLVEQFVSATPATASQLASAQAGTPTAPASVATDKRILNLYNSQGELAFTLKSTGGNAQVTALSYDLAGKLLTSKSYAVEVAYNLAYTTASLTSALSAALTGKGLTDGANALTQFVYNKAGQLRFTVNALGQVIEQQYDDAGRVSATIQRTATVSGIQTYLGLKTKFVPNVLAATDRATHTLYDSLGRVQFVVNAAYLITEHSYNELGNVIATKHYGGRIGPGIAITESNLISIRSSLDRVTTFVYDALGQVADEYSPALTGEQAIWSLQNGAYVKLTTAYGHKKYTYDALGQVRSIEEGAVNTIGGAFVGQTRKTRFDFDAAGHQIRVYQPDAVNAEGSKTETTYDAFGNAVMNLVYKGTSTPAEAKFKVYDAAGQVLFDVEAKVVSNNATTGFVTAYEYDSFGNQKKVTRYKNSIDLRAAAGTAFAGVLSERYLRDRLVVSGDDRSLDVRFDAAGRKTSIKESARPFSYLTSTGALQTGTAQPETLYEYNAFGQLYRQSVLTGKPGESLDSYCWYDTLGRQVKSLDTMGYLTTQLFNRFGELQTRTEHARIVSGSWNVSLVPATPTAGDSNTGLDRVVDYEYDALGHQTKQIQKNVQLSTTNTIASITQSQDFDAFGNLSRQITTDGATYFSYDVLGNLLKTTGPATQQVQDVGALSQLSSLDSQLVSRSRVTTMTYDIFGNTLEVRQLAGATANNNTDVVQSFEYNARGQQIRQSERFLADSAGEVQSKVTQSFYDYQGRLLHSDVSYSEVGPVRVVAKTGVREYYVVKRLDKNGEPSSGVTEEDAVLRKEVTSLSWLRIDLATGTVSGTPPSTGTLKDVVITVQNASNQLVSIPLNLGAMIKGVAISQVVSALKLGGGAGNSMLFQTLYQYDSLGQQLSTTRLKKNLTAAQLLDSVTEVAAYNAFGEMEQKSAIGKDNIALLMGTYSYNKSGQLEGSTEADGVKKTNKLDLAGRVVAVADHQRGETRFDLTKAGKQAKVYQPGLTAGAFWTTSQTFDRWGNVLTLTDAQGAQYSYRYNQFNQVLQETKPKVWVTSTSGARTEQASVSYYTYDTQGRRVAATNANGALKTFSYHSDGQLAWETDGADATAKTRYVYDSFGRKVATQDGAGGLEYQQLNALGQVLESGRLVAGKNSSGVAQTVRLTLQSFGYNAMGERMSATDALGASYYYRYDAKSNLVASVSPTKLLREYEYDALNRKVKERSGDTVGAVLSWKDQTWVYASNGALTQYDLSNKTHATSYLEGGSGKTGGLVKQQTNGYGLNQTYSYYSNGLLKQVGDPAGNSSYYEYNAAGQRTLELHKSKDSAGVMVVLRVENKYDLLGRLVLTRSFDGESSTTARMLSQSAYQYDAQGNRRSITTANGLEGLISRGPVLSPSWNGATASYKEGQAVSLALNGVGVTPGALKYRISSGTLPSGLSLNPDTGAISGKIAANAVSGSGDHWNTQAIAFVVAMTDTISGELKTQSLQIRVQNIPTAWVSANRALPAITGKAKLALSVSAGTFAQGLDGNLVGLTVTAPSWLSYDAVNRVFKGTPPAAGSYSYEVQVSDGAHGVSKRTGSVVIAANGAGPANVPPTVLVNNKAYSQTRFLLDRYDDLEDVYLFVRTSDIFRDDNGDALTVSISGLQSNLKWTAVTGGYSISQVTAGANAGNFSKTYTLTASDGKGGSAQANITFRVTTVVENTDPRMEPRVNQPLALNTFSPLSEESGTAVMAEPEFMLAESEPMLVEPEFTRAESEFTLAEPEFTRAESEFMLAESEFMLARAESEPMLAESELTQAVGTLSSSLPATPAKLKTAWFSYDGENRVLVDGGALVNGQVSAASQGVLKLYNKAGLLEFEVNMAFNSAQRYVYNSQQQLTATMKLANTDLDLKTNPGAVRASNLDWRKASSFEYDLSGRVVAKYDHYQSLTYVEVDNADYGDFGPKSFTVTVDIRGGYRSVQRTRYNADGEVLSVSEQRPHTSEQQLARQAAGTRRSYIEERTTKPVARIDHLATEALLVAYDSVTEYQARNEAGLFTSFSFKDYKPDGRTIEASRNFTKQYELRDQWLEKKVVGTGTAASGSISPGNMFIGYNASGQKLTLEDQNAVDLKNISTRKMVYAADGSLLRKGEGKSTALVGSTTATGYVEQSFSRHISSNGHYLGEVSQRKFNSTSAPYYTDTLMQQNGAGMEQGDGSSVQKYTTQAGDSLRGIALAFYGSSDYWYLIANRNGLPSEPDSVLSVGQTLDIPSRATKVNQADSFKPLQLEKLIGDTTPSLPQLPPPPSSSCNAVAMIVMVVITVVATVFTAGAAAVAMSGGIGALGGATAGTLAAVGGAAMGGSFGVIGMAAAAVGGFVGSAVGQLAGKAMGVVDSFSLKNAFASGLTAGATAGMGGYVKGMEWAQAAGDASKFGYMGKMAMAAAASGTNWAANKLAGNNQVSFSWRSVVTSTVSAGAGSLLGFSDQSSMLSRFNEGGGLLNGTLDGIAGAAINYGVGKGLYNQGGWDFGKVATDAFGNALANTAISEAIKGGRAASDKVQQAKMDKMFDATSRKINAKLDAQQHETLVTQQQRITGELANNADALLSSGTARLESENEASFGRYQHARLNLAESANVSSAAYAADAVALTLRHNSQMQNLQAGASAALAAGMARGESMHAAGLRNRAPVGPVLITSEQANGYINFMQGQREAAYSRVGLGAGAANGNFGDFATWYGASLANESWQVIQFMGKAVVNGLTLGSMNDMFSPLSSGYHSLIGDDTLFGNPTTFAGAIGRDSGVVGSYVIDPLAAAGLFGKLSKYDVNLNTIDMPSYAYVGQEVNSAFGQGGAVINGKYIRTVPTDVSASFQGMGYLDPLTNTFKAAPLNQTLAVDHIFPAKEIQELRGFNKLTMEQQVAIIQDSVGIGNFQPLPPSLNQSKGAKLDWSTYKGQGIDPVYQQNLIDTQSVIRQATEQQIRAFTKLNRGG